MPPVMKRKASQERCRQGWELRCRGRTWQEIADELGFRSRQTANTAVNAWLRANPPDEIETLRRATGTVLVDTAGKCRDAMDEAIKAGKYRDAAELGKVAIDGFEKYAKLTGQHVVVPKEVSVHIQSVTEIIASTRAQLEATLDAEVLSVVEDPPKAVGA